MAAVDSDITMSVCNQQYSRSEAEDVTSVLRVLSRKEGKVQNCTAGLCLISEFGLWSPFLPVHLKCAFSKVWLPWQKWESVNR